MSVAAPMARKRPAPDQEPHAADANKRPRHKGFRSIDDFEPFEVLGEGSEGVVSRARDRRTGKEVALKWIRGDGPDDHGPPDRRALAMEAGCLRACRSHPSIIEIHGVAADPKTGEVHLVLELIEGGMTLRDTFWGTLTEDDIRGMMRQLIGAAKKVHSLGFIHRDIKSDNILVCPSGELKVADFASATRQKPDGKPHKAWCVETLQYNSPELLDGNWNYGPAIDMWALGCVMVELLNGEARFQAESEEDMTAEMYALRDRMTSAAGKLDPQCLAELSKNGRDLLTGLLAFCPEKRLTAVEALEHRWFKNVQAAH